MVRLEESNWHEESVAHANFNSTMVRLEVDRSIKDLARWKYFNSTMVRLEVCFSFEALHLGEFQFHYGTIRSIVPLRCPSTNNDFNSTMVRLEAFGLRA